MSKIPHFSLFIIYSEGFSYLEYHGYSHGVEDRVLLRETFLREDSWPAILSMLLLVLREVSGLDKHDQDEAESQPDVSDVAEDVIESLEYGPRSGTTVVEEALLIVLTVGKYKLRCWDCVEQGNFVKIFKI